MKAQRWRILFGKTEAMRFTGHLDLILTWERTFRRSGLPLSYSEGFNPRPVINLAAPLPLGFTSTGEIGDFWLSTTVSHSEFSAALTGALPPGLNLISAVEIEQLHGNKLPSLVEAAVYQITLDYSDPDLPARIKSVLAAEEIVRIRRNKEYDLRPLILTLSLTSPATADHMEIETTLSLLPGATGRPDEVLSALGIAPLEASICRKKILLDPPQAME